MLSFFTGYVIEGFLAQNEKCKDFNVGDIKNLCDEMFVSMVFTFCDICVDTQRDVVLDVKLPGFFYFSKFYPKRSLD